MPFTQEQFFEVFQRYNSTLGFGLWLFYLTAVLSVLVLYKNSKANPRFILFLLSCFWIWMGVVYHWIFFSKINPAAWIFGGLFVLQSLFLAGAAWKRWKVEISPITSVRGAFQACAILYSLLIYPLLGLAFGHGYPAGPIFGLPCPTTIFTFAILSAVNESRPRVLVLSTIPLLWAVLGTSAAAFFGVYEDYALGLSALVFLLVQFFPRFASQPERQLISF